jgi:hypothetical protein
MPAFHRDYVVLSFPIQPCLLWISPLCALPRLSVSRGCPQQILTTYSAHEKTLAENAEQTSSILRAAFMLAFFADVLVAGSMCYILASKKTDINECGDVCFPLAVTDR